ncbi:DNA adenine methylase [Ferrovibrio sp.]|uniref:DNA adenine methylase n=1 Tax=Ferrovibrio sp. TaxID=1917215 RepID=UPI00345CDE92
MKPVAPYIGGKRNLAGRLAEIIGRVPHATYVEPFVGMGGVFFRRTAKPAGEVINDISGDVATLFRVLQRHYQYFINLLQFELTTRKRFEQLVRTDPTTLTDLERAARFLYLQRTSFGGKVAARSFGVVIGSGARFDVTKLGPLLEAVHERLAGTVIECLPWPELIDRYDRPDTLFYLDPPYYGCEKDYGRDVFSRDDFKALAERLAQIKGRFVLSLNDVPAVRQIFAGFKIESVETTYTVGGAGKAKRVAEVIITDRATRAVATRRREAA